MSDFLNLLRALTNPATPIELTDAQVDALIVRGTDRPLDEPRPCWPEDK